MAEEAAAAAAPVNFDEDEEVTPGYVAPAKVGYTRICRTS